MNEENHLEDAQEQTPQYLEMPKRDFPFIWYSLSITFIVLVIYFLGTGILSEFILNDETMITMGYLNAGAQIMFLLFPILFASYPIPLKFRTIFRWEEPLNIKILSLAFLALIFFQFFVSGYSVLQEHLIPNSLMYEYLKLKDNIEGLYHSLLGGDTYFDFLRSILIAAFVPAIAEEFVFRGFLQRSLEEKLKPVIAIIISGVFFGMIHFNPIDMLPLIMIGIFLGYLAYVSGNILIPIIIHFANNAFAISMFYLADVAVTDSAAGELSLMLSLLFCFGGLAFVLLICYMIYGMREQ
jgi:membrane protease YdiL (CAAX protease family)